MAITSFDRVYVGTHDCGANVAFREVLGLRFAGWWVRESHCVGKPGTATTAVVPADAAPGTPAAFNAFSPSAAPMPTLWEKL
jgi:hypothetical protein